uniref:ascorbate ferrireductase (transmembrane) n=1 Tax=Gallus gallus TaxID=9031 RepID=A0A8V1AHL4_CHICK
MPLEHGQAVGHQPPPWEAWCSKAAFPTAQPEPPRSAQPPHLQRGEVPRQLLDDGLQRAGLGSRVADEAEVEEQGVAAVLLVLDAHRAADQLLLHGGAAGGQEPVPSAGAAGLFSWHPLLMALAVSLLMTEALLAFSPEASPLRGLSRKAKARAHWVLQALAVLCAALGLGLVAYNKHLHGTGHLRTWHGRIGLLTVLYFAVQSLGGLPLLYPKLAGSWPPGKLRLYHATAGLVGYLLGCASLTLGMCSLWFTTAARGAAWYLAVLCPVLTSLVVMNQVSNAYLYRKRSQH